MNQKNLGYLSEHVREAGFPETLIQKLTERLKDAPGDFSVPAFYEKDLTPAEYAHWVRRGI